MAHKRRPRPRPAPALVLSQPARRPPLQLIPAVLLPLIPFLLGKYIEFNSPGVFDSGAYVYSAEHMLRGAKLGVDEVASARPGTLLVNVIGVRLFGFSELGPKLIQTLMQALALAMMFVAVRSLWGLLAACVSATVTAFYVSAPVIAKFGNVKEQYMIALMVISVCSLILYDRTNRRYWPVLAGACLINIYYFKVTGLSAILAAVAFLLAGPISRKWRLVQLGEVWCLMLAGAAVGLLPLAAMFVWQDQMVIFRATLPLMFVQIAAGPTVLGVLIYLVAPRIRWRQLAQRLLTVRREVKIAAVAAVIVAIVPFVGFACIGELGSFVSELPVVHHCIALYYRGTAFTRQVRITLAGGSSYVVLGRQAMDLSRQAGVVLRYYMVLKLPMLMALSSLVLLVVRTALRAVRKDRQTPDPVRILLMLIGWWVLDTVFVWISPRPFEEYYLPLNASAAMLGAYLIGVYARNLASSASKGGWLAAGAVGGIVMIALASPVYFGLTVAPYSGAKYPQPSRGYVQRLEDIRLQRQTGRKAPWENVATHIREHSKPDDGLYVWGWYPGIYVVAQRMCPVPKAFESEMHVLTPQALSRQTQQTIETLSARPPVFIVDSRKREFPYDRPPLELWPQIPDKGFIPRDPKAVAQYEKGYRTAIEKAFGDTEAQRFDAMAPLRSFVMQNYDIVQRPEFGEHVVFRRREAPQDSRKP